MVPGLRPAAARGSGGSPRGPLGCGRSSHRCGAGRPAMLDGRPLIDAHQHPVRLPTVKPAWMDWAERFGQPGWREAYTADGEIVPRALGALMQAEGVDHALVICEYSPKTTGMQPAEDLLPLTAYEPGRFSLVANVNPHLHYPVDAELARQQAL